MVSVAGKIITSENGVKFEELENFGLPGMDELS